LRTTLGHMQNCSYLSQVYDEHTYYISLLDGFVSANVI